MKKKKIFNEKRAFYWWNKLTTSQKRDYENKTYDTGEWYEDNSLCDDDVIHMFKKFKKTYVGFSYIMPFGKYKGKTLFDISEENPSYISWLDKEKIYNVEDDLLIKCLNDTMSPDFEDLHSDWGCRD